MSLSDELEDFFSESKETIVKEPLKFKAKLGIGEKAYSLLRSREKLTTFNESIGIGTAASGIAASGVVANTFFTSSGFLSLVGLGTAATPIGWVIAAGVITGGAYMGISHIFERSKDTGLIVVPKFINTPLDIIAASLIELMLPVSLKMANAGGGLKDAELRTIQNFFVDEWGYCPGFVAKLIDEYRCQTNAVSYSKLAKSLGSYCADSPDCDKEVIMAGFVAHLREIIEADGRIHEDERVEIDYLTSLLIVQSEKNGGSSSVSEAIKRASQGLSSTATFVSDTATNFGAKAGSGASRFSKSAKKAGQPILRILSVIRQKVFGLFKLGSHKK